VRGGTFLQKGYPRKYSFERILVLDAALPSSPERGVDEFDSIAVLDAECLKIFSVHKAAVDLDYHSGIIFIEPVQQILNSQTAPIQLLWKAVKDDLQFLASAVAATLAGRSLDEIGLVHQYYASSGRWPQLLVCFHTSAHSNGENNFRAPSALTWCPGQWHPTAIQPRPLGATDLSPLRSVLDPAICSACESGLASGWRATDWRTQCLMPMRFNKSNSDARGGLSLPCPGGSH
jgi:hypothetical protein